MIMENDFSGDIFGRLCYGVGSEIYYVSVDPARLPGGNRNSVSYTTTRLSLNQSC